jgi:hypothetical protein
VVVEKEVREMKVHAFRQMRAAAAQSDVTSNSTPHTFKLRTRSKQSEKKLRRSILRESRRLGSKCSIWCPAVEAQGAARE